MDPSQVYKMQSSKRGCFSLQLYAEATETTLPAFFLTSFQLGHQKLLAWIRKYMDDMHLDEKFKGRVFGTCVSCGGQDALQRAFDCVLDEEDTLLMEASTYSGAIAATRATGCKLVAVSMDEFGILPKSLESILSTWDEQKEGHRRPKALYVVPTANNPTSATIPTDRRREIYSICQRYNILIFEDDPYWNLLYPSSEHYGKLVSFFKMDTDNRVIRFDSFSKIFAVGLRVGWVSGPSRLVEAISYDIEAGAQHASAAAQLELISALDSWGEAGFAAHIAHTQSFYETRCATFMKLVAKHLSPLGVTAATPDAGMFAWFNLGALGIKDTSDLVKNLAEKHGVLFVPGAAFSPEPRPSHFVRAAFSTHIPASSFTC